MLQSYRTCPAISRRHVQTLALGAQGATRKGTACLSSWPQGHWVQGLPPSGLH